MEQECLHLIFYAPEQGTRVSTVGIKSDNIWIINISEGENKTYKHNIYKSGSTGFNKQQNWEATTKLAIQLQNNILDFYGQNSTIGHYLLAVIMILAIPWPIIPQKNPTEPYMTPCNLNSLVSKLVQTNGSGPAN